jgi:hypothetical protein
MNGAVKDSVGLNCALSNIQNNQGTTADLIANQSAVYSGYIITARIRSELLGTLVKNVFATHRGYGIAYISTVCSQTLPIYWHTLSLPIYRQCVVKHRRFIGVHWHRQYIVSVQSNTADVSAVFDCILVKPRLVKTADILAMFYSSLV